MFLTWLQEENESKTLTKDISCKCECKFNGTKFNSNQLWNNDKCQCECKKHYICENAYVSNPATSNCENGKYLALIICNEVMDVRETDFNENKVTWQTQFFIFYLNFCKLPLHYW